MATKPKRSGKTRKSTSSKRSKRGASRLRRVIGWLKRGVIVVAAAFAVLILAFGVLRPPTTPYILAEAIRNGGVERQWVRMGQIAPVMARSVVAAEDANFCLHWGFDMGAIREALEDGAGRGASTLTQQTVKNVFLWHGRSWPRKAMEALITPAVELVWTKRRIVEMYER